jgi:hypothetical protein
VQAVDNAPVNPKSDRVFVYIYVTLDQYPYFQPSTYPVQSVQDAQIVGVTIRSVTAFDPDLKVSRKSFYNVNMQKKN